VTPEDLIGRRHVQRLHVWASEDDARNVRHEVAVVDGIESICAVAPRPRAASIARISPVSSITGDFIDFSLD
jgi:hypothetical protein